MEATNYSSRFMHVTTLTSRYHGTPSLIPLILSNIIEFQFFTFQIKSSESKSQIRKAGALGMHRVLSIGEICSLIGIAVC